MGVIIGRPWSASFAQRSHSLRKLVPIIVKASKHSKCKDHLRIQQHRFIVVSESTVEIAFAIPDRPPSEIGLRHVGLKFDSPFIIGASSVEITFSLPGVATREISLEIIRPELDRFVVAGECAIPVTLGLAFLRLNKGDGSSRCYRGILVDRIPNSVLVTLSCFIPLALSYVNAAKTEVEVPGLRCELHCFAEKLSRLLELSFVRGHAGLRGVR